MNPSIKICILADTLDHAERLISDGPFVKGPITKEDGVVVCGPLGALIGARVDLLILDQSFDPHIEGPWYHEVVLGRLTKEARIVRYEA